MSNLVFTLDSETLNLAIEDLSAKLKDLELGSKNAPKHFEAIIGSDDHPDIAPSERIVRLSTLRDELEAVLRKVEGQDEGSITDLSGYAIEVLSGYARDEERVMLCGPHVTVGRGVPSAHLYLAATTARLKMMLLLKAIATQGPDPDVVFHQFFEAYEEILEEDDEADEEQDDVFICDAAIAYFDEILEDLETAWEEGVEIPECLNEYVLQPYLRDVSKSLLH
jgi:hypothetical protein